MQVSEQIKELSREDLIVMMNEFLPIVQGEAALRRRIAELEMEVNRLRGAAATVKRDPIAKIEKTAKDPNLQKTPGRQVSPGGGDEAHLLIDNPYQTINARVRRCTVCKTNLKDQPPERIVRRRFTELPEIRPQQLVTRRHEARCPHCRAFNQGEFPAGVATDRTFGSRLESVILYLNEQLGLRHESILDALKEMFRVELNEQELEEILAPEQRRSELDHEAATGPATASNVIEFSAIAKARRSGERASNQGKRNASSGSTKDIKKKDSVEKTNAAAGVLGKNSPPTHLKEPPRVPQLCLKNQITELQKALDRNPAESWAKAVQRLFLEAMELREKIGAPMGLTQQEYLTRVMELEKMLDELLTHQLSAEETRQLQQRYLEHRTKLLAFLYHPEVRLQQTAKL